MGYTLNAVQSWGRCCVAARPGWGSPPPLCGAASHFPRPRLTGRQRVCDGVGVGGVRWATFPSPSTMGWALSVAPYSTGLQAWLATPPAQPPRRRKCAAAWHRCVERGGGGGAFYCGTFLCDTQRTTSKDTLPTYPHINFHSLPPRAHSRPRDSPTTAPTTTTTAAYLSM